MSVEIGWETYCKMWAYARAVDTEIIGIGFSEVVDGAIHVKDIRIVPQTVTATEAEINNPVEVMDSLTADEFAHYNTTWHSHLNGVFVSGQDKEHIANFMREASWWLSLIINQPDGKLLARVDSSNPVHVGAEVSVDIMLPPGIAEEVKEKVKEKQYGVVQYPGMGWDNGKGKKGGRKHYGHHSSTQGARLLQPEKDESTYLDHWSGVRGLLLDAGFGEDELDDDDMLG